MFRQLFILVIVCSIWSSGIAKAIETNETPQSIQGGVYSTANATKIDVKGSLIQRKQEEDQRKIDERKQVEKQRKQTEEDQRKIDERKQVEKQRKQTDNLIKGGVYSALNASKIDVKGSLIKRVTEEDQRKIAEREQVEKQRKQTDNLIKGGVLLIVALGGIYGLIKGVLYIKSKMRLPIEITIKYKQEK